MIKKSGDDVTYRSLYMLPVGYTCKHRKGFTLIGDAAHLMTPFAGEGVNLAFADCLKLAETIRTAFNSAGSGANMEDALDRQIRVYEEDMFRRAKKAQKMTEGMMTNMFFTKGAPDTAIESWVLNAVTYDINDWLLPIAYPVMVGLVYGYFFLAKRLWI